MGIAPQVGGGVRRHAHTLLVRSSALLYAGLLLISTGLARADTYYVTIAGLGGEPDYEQRFTKLAMDLDRVFKSGGATAHVFTLSGKEATRSHLGATLATVAQQAK